MYRVRSTAEESCTRVCDPSRITATQEEGMRRDSEYKGGIGRAALKPLLLCGSHRAGCLTGAALLLIGSGEIGS